MKPQTGQVGNLTYGSRNHACQKALHRSLFVRSLAPAAQAENAKTRHLLYVVAPGIRDQLEYGGAGILVFDMDKNHAFVKRIQTPASQLKKPENIKGVCACSAARKLYFTTLTKLYCLDLVTEKTLWEKTLPGGCDRMSITPDGKTLYVPSYEKDSWNIVDGATGSIIAQIVPKSGAHNTLVSLDGSEAYLAGLRSPLLPVVDTATQQNCPHHWAIRQRHSPFHRSTRTRLAASSMSTACSASRSAI